MKLRAIQLIGALALGAAVTTAGLGLAENARRTFSETPSPVPVGAELFDRWCLDTFGPTFRSSNLTGTDPLQWRCWGERNGITLEREISVVDLCVQFVSSDYTAQLNGTTNTWECVAQKSASP
jgi:hypothetical protein